MQKLWLGQKKLSYFRYSCLAYLIFFFNFFPLASSEMLNKIPKQDKKQLEDLFNYFTTNSTFPYTLFGNKPVSWICITLPRFPEFKSSQKVIHRSTNKSSLWKKWQVWKKYEKQFPLIKYHFIEETESNRKDIFIINKKYFISIVNQHQDLFESILHQKVSGESLLEEMEKQSSFRKVIQNNDLLLGILLGFGEHNSSLYQQREDLEKLYKLYQSMLIADTPAFQDLENKAEKITNILMPFNDSCNSYLIVGSPSFMVDATNQETRTLKSNYEKLQHEISKLYHSRNVLEITINQLTSEKESVEFEPRIYNFIKEILRLHFQVIN